MKVLLVSGFEEKRAQEFSVSGLWQSVPLALFLGSWQLLDSRAISWRLDLSCTCRSYRSQGDEAVKTLQLQTFRCGFHLGCVICGGNGGCAAGDHYVQDRIDGCPTHGFLIRGLLGTGPGSWRCATPDLLRGSEFRQATNRRTPSPVLQKTPQFGTWV